MFSVNLWEKKNNISENLFYPVYVVYVASVRLERPWTSAQRVMIQLLMVAQDLLWLYRLTWERQSRLQRIHVKTLSRDDFVLFSFHRARFSLVASLRLFSPRWQASVYSLLASALDVNRVLNISERWRSLPTSRCPSLPYPFCRCPWSEDEVVLVPVTCSPYRRIFRILTCGTQYTYSNQRSLLFWEGCVGWLTRHWWELRYCWPGRTNCCSECVSISEDERSWGATRVWSRGYKSHCSRVARWRRILYKLSSILQN